MSTATLDRPKVTTAKGFRSGATTHPILKGKDVAEFTPGEHNATSLLAAIGGDFTVAKTPLLLETPDGVLYTTGLYAITEGDVKMHGTAVSEKYPTYQFNELAENVDEILDMFPGAQLEGGFLLHGGALVLFIVDFGIGYTVGQINGQYDRVEQKLIVSAGHGGKGAVKGSVQQLRFFCQNQLPSLSGRYNRRNGVLYEQHTEAGIGRLDNLPELVSVAHKYAQQDAEIAEVMSEIAESKERLEQFLREGPGKFTAATKRGQSLKDNNVDRVLTRFGSEPQNAWGAYNAIGWFEETRGDEKFTGGRAARNLARSIDGSGTPRALRYVDYVLPDSMKKRR